MDTKQIIVLTGKTAKGKNRLREVVANIPCWDGLWIVQNELEHVAFANGMRGPWLFIVPRCADSINTDRHSRWIHATEDENFFITVQ